MVRRKWENDRDYYGALKLVTGIALLLVMLISLAAVQIGGAR